MTFGKVAYRSLWLSLALALPSVAFSADHSGPGISADEALKRIQEGNERFAAGKSIHAHADAKWRRMTAKEGQHPFVTVLACSDAREPVELLLDQGIGDVFVIRVAGNVCNVDETGSIEYGVAHVGTPLLVVLGHTNCGAVTVTATKDEVYGSIPALVASIRPAVVKAEKAHPDLHGADLVPAATEFNVWQSIDDLLKGSAIVRKRAQEGQVKILGAIYDLQSGKVKWLGEHPEMSRLLKYTDAAGHDGPKHADEPAAQAAPRRGSRFVERLRLR